MKVAISTILTPKLTQTLFVNFFTKNNDNISCICFQE